MLKLLETLSRYMRVRQPALSGMLTLICASIVLPRGTWL